MTKKLSMLVVAMTLWAISATAQLNVKGYYRKDGTGMCIRKAAYSSSTDLIIGHITEYVDGDVWIYDFNGKLIKRIKPKRK
ncbi:hypothetical protein SAMN04488511_11435 [Pedobacter suwonensis]|uniref:WG containing repeat-containing protein n=1 Tax=Pedobacter suwonensis TaxID=332999 RepID=A0A1I0TSU9_9SPHI|nr:hypothetical protein [Pedobacter suwonensis]SFA54884.1 hypothetical protein SAMN04488511_11435 [Pedobacter suwonensis]